MAVLEQVDEISSRREAADLVTELFSIIKESLTMEQKVLVSGFGKFTARDKRGRIGRNPSTGGPLLIEARRAVSFKASDRLRTLMNADDPKESKTGGVSEVARLDASPRSRAALTRRSG